MGRNGSEHDATSVLTGEERIRKVRAKALQASLGLVARVGPDELGPSEAAAPELLLVNPRPMTEIAPRLIPSTFLTRASATRGYLP